MISWLILLYFVRIQSVRNYFGNLSDIITLVLGPVIHKWLDIDFIANYKLLVNLFDILSYSGGKSGHFCVFMKAME